MDSLNFYNNTVTINDLWYDSHRSLIERVATELDQTDKINLLVDKFLGKSLKLKKFKDPNKPKRAKTSYLYFCQEMRPTVKSKNPDLKLGGVMKELGKMWGKLSDKEKEKYEELYQEDKIRYEEEIEEYY